MFTRKSACLALCAVVLGVVSVASVHAGGSAARTAHITFSGPVSLPGVALGTGTYIFELSNPSNRLDLVTVMDRSRSHVYFTGFTRSIARSPGSAQPVALGEAPLGGSPRVIAWYPQDDAMGHQFVYANSAP
jgi:hypothetical protein